jgi:hypothetical protein
VWDVKDGPNISLSCDCWGLSLLSNLFFLCLVFFCASLMMVRLLAILRIV